jgi:nitrogen PTS system EIIA component
LTLLPEKEKSGMISVREAAEILQVSQKTVYRWITEGKLPVKRLGRQFYLERADVNDLLTQEGKIIPEIPGTEPDIDIPLSEMLEKAGIFYRIHGNTIQEVIYNALSNVKGVDAKIMDPIYRMFLSREELASTGIGDGIAIPHARGTLVGYVSHPLLSLSFLENPVEFNAIDGEPVQALFLLISPNVKTHLRILAKLSYVLQDPDCKETIVKQDSRDKILEAVRKAEERFRKKNGNIK